jgi:hypothetical protein
MSQERLEEIIHLIDEAEASLESNENASCDAADSSPTKTKKALTEQEAYLEEVLISS